MCVNCVPQAGAVVRLFHREGECYVAAEGSFAENPAVVEDGRANVMQYKPILAYFLLLIIHT